MSSNESRFKVLLTVRGKVTKTVSTNHICFEEKREPKRYWTELNSLPVPVKVAPKEYEQNELQLLNATTKNGVSNDVLQRRMFIDAWGLIWGREWVVVFV